MANLVEVLLKAVDEVTPTINKISKESTKASGEMQKNWAGTGKSLQAVGVVALAMGAGIEMLARSNAPLLESTRRLADYLDMDTKAMQKLVLETSNVSFPLNEVLTLMETGTKLGLDSAESLKKYAEFWDMVGDATGESSTALAESAVALKALGISAGEEGKTLNALGFIQKNTTMQVGEFISSIGRLAPEMREMNMTIDDSAVILGILQREFGMTSRTSLAEFRRGVTESKGDVEKLKEILGITGEMFDTYSQKVAESSDVIAENAKRNNELYTPMQKIQHALSELKYRMGDFIQGAANYAPLLTGIGSAMTIVGTVMKSHFFPSIMLAVKGVWAFTASLLANPLTWWIIGITAVITAIVLLWKNWDKVTEWISRKVDWIVDKFQWLGDKIKWVAEKLGIYKEKTIEMAESTDKLKESGDKAGTSLERVGDTSEITAGKIGDLTVKNEELGTSLEGLPDKLVIASDSIKLYGEDIAENYIQLAGRATDSWDDFYAFWEAEAKRTAGEIKQTVSTVIDAWGVAHKVWTDIKEDVAKGTKSNLYKIVDASGKTIGLQTGNIISQAMKNEGITLVKLHEGTSIVRTAIPGGEGLALLKDREIVTQEKASLESRNNIISLNIHEGAFKFILNKLDEAIIRNSGKLLFDELYNQCRAHGIVLGRA